MPSARWSWGLVAIIAVLGGASCSKTNNVNQNKTLAVGQQCDERDDAACGTGAVCALGFCRSGCTTDLECARGAICVGDQEPFGCSLPSELSCSSAQPCSSAALSCGLDGICRAPCQTANDCPRNEHECIAGNCITKNDPGYAALSSCGSGPTERCDGASYQTCNVGAAGWNEVSNCGSDLCALPAGRCLEQVATLDAAPAAQGNLSLSGEQLYWLSESNGDATNLYASALTLGSTASLVMTLSTLPTIQATLSGGLVATITTDSKVEMYRANDGTVLVSVPVLFPNGSDLSAPMPTNDGVFWIEREHDPEAPNNLVFAALDATTGEVFAPMPGEPSLSYPVQFCGDAQQLYFTDSATTLYRATPGGVEAVMSAVDAVACRANDVLVGTPTGLVSLKPDGTQKKLLDLRFNDLQVLGNKVFGNSPVIDEPLWVGDLVTGTTEPLYTGLPLHVSTAPLAADADYVYFFGVNKHTLVRGAWH